MNVAFLLDADNLSSAADVDQIFAHFRRLGITVTVRRAYGGTEKLVGMKEVLRQHAVRSFINQGKGTTDAALVIDAMDLLHHDALPSMVAIGSSDADFAPLAVRLREDGIRVLCFALRDKADGDALALVYDEVVYLDSPSRAERVDRAERVERAAPAPARKAPAAKKAPARPAAAKKAVGKVFADEDDELDAILEAVPALLSGEQVPLNDVTKQLRDAKVLGRSARSTALLGRHAADFRLTPERNPAYVQWMARTGR
ncbi:NYN domain-containing protein [Caenimonas terrae]|uniref:NYN domain-containing protein n=1 Tax=Caenimonas terrae TaxID=696074 RepID=A0ABW0NI64_9BURK